MLVVDVFMFDCNKVKARDHRKHKTEDGYMTHLHAFHYG